MHEGLGEASEDAGVEKGRFGSSSWEAAGFNAQAQIHVLGSCAKLEFTEAQMTKEANAKPRASPEYPFRTLRVGLAATALHLRQPVLTRVMLKLNKIKQEIP